MTGRPGYRTMEMIGGSSEPYLARTPCVPLFVLCLIGVETEGVLHYKGRAGTLRPVIFGVEILAFPISPQAAAIGFARESQKALETTTAMKRRKISCPSLSF